MQSTTLSIRKNLAVLLLLFPATMMLAFLLHFSSVHAFFNFRLHRDPYDAGKLFDALVGGRGHGFVMAHTVGFLSIPLFMIATLLLAWLLYKQNPIWAFIGAVIGIIGCAGMAAVFGAWLSLSGIHTLDQQYYTGAREGFIELVKMQGMLKFFTMLSYLSFIGLAILAAGLAWAKQFKLINMLSIITGTILFVVFMDMDNWMFIGSVLLLIGFIPVSKQLRNSSNGGVQ
jgi:hypothetical protein